MAVYRTINALLFIIAAVESASQRTAPSPATDCSTVVLNMADCLSYVTQGSTVVKPEGSCCSGLKTVLKTDAECLCEGFKNSAQFGVTLNVTKAFALPSACHVSAPSVGDCGLAIGSNAGAAPGLSPASTLPPSSTEATTSTPVSAANDEVAPTPAPQSSGSSTFSSASTGLFAIILVALISFSFSF